MELISIDRVIGGLYRELKNSDLNETDLIEWAGEALDFLKTPEIQTQSVAFLKVKNYETDIPKGFQMVLQMAMYNENIDDISCEEDDIINCGIDELNNSYQSYFSMQWQYEPWTNSTYFIRKFIPIRLSDHTLFNTVVCKEKKVYESSCQEEYTIVGTTHRKFRFSFKEGLVALSYIKSAIDEDTGYPLIPDSISHITAIKYYIKWKISEYELWEHREGSQNLVRYNMDLWLKYAKQAKNFARMPKTIDDLQNLLEQSHQLVPKLKRYYGYFGNLNKSQYAR